MHTNYVIGGEICGGFVYKGVVRVKGNQQEAVQDSELVVVVQLLSHVRLFKPPWTAARPVSLSFISWSLLKLTSMESDAIPLFHPLLPPSSALNLSQHQGLF